MQFEPLLDLFIFETTQLLEQLEQDILVGEESNILDENSINEIFRIMHTIKGSSAMMMFHNISAIAHNLEDLFYYLREENPQKVKYSAITDIVLEVTDFIRSELEHISSQSGEVGDESKFVLQIQHILSEIKRENIVNELESIYKDATDLRRENCGKQIEQSFRICVYFEKDCQMEDTRALAILNDLKDQAEISGYYPNDILDNEQSSDVIRLEGFHITLSTKMPVEELKEYLEYTPCVSEVTITLLDEKSDGNIALDHESTNTDMEEKESKKTNQSMKSNSLNQSMISVNVEKLDMLMDLVGEIVIAEAMVLQNPDLMGLRLNQFKKSASQLQKLTNELRDIVMSIRMVPLSSTFHKMLRIVRDMSKNLDKDVQLKLVGEETEVDKNIIEKISDPVMHLVRNAIDHGIESVAERKKTGKSPTGNITLEAKNSGSDVWIIIKDDGKGLNREEILKIAEKNEILYKSTADMTDKDVFNLIFSPGFSTKESITEYSGRGVGMDVVAKNVESVGGSVSVESEAGAGTSVILKIPLTLAIIDGMNIKVGESRYTIPINSIKESFKPNKRDIIRDPDGFEIILVRGQSYPILRLHKYYQVETKITNLDDGIFIMVEQDNRSLCLFADELLGQQQVVVKSLPTYMKNGKKINGLAGCTLLGDGRISLILDINGMLLTSA